MSTSAPCGALPSWRQGLILPRRWNSRSRSVLHSSVMGTFVERCRRLKNASSIVLLPGRSDVPLSHVSAMATICMVESSIARVNVRHLTGWA